MVPDDDEPVELDVPGVDEPDVDEPDVDEPDVVCAPEKSTADVMPAAARLESPTIDVTHTATRFPADRESMSTTSGVERIADCDETTFGRLRPSTLSVTHHLSKTRPIQRFAVNGGRSVGFWL